MIIHTTTPDNRPLRLMPREMRMMSERIFSLSAMPRGFVLTLTDIPMYSQWLGLGGFALLHKDHDKIMAGDLAALRVVAEHGAALTLDLSDQPAWIGVNSILDLAAELVAAHGSAEITVINAAHPEELAVTVALAGRTGLVMQHHAQPGGARLLAQSLDGAQDRSDPIMQSLYQDGIMLAPELWWAIYETARTALAPDTALSRRHAGVQIVNDDGSIIGRTDNDDDADVSFLARGAREQTSRSAQ